MSSSNDSTRPEDDGRTVATDADGAQQSSPPVQAAEDGSASGAAAGRPSPVPRSASSGTDTRWETSAADADGTESGSSNGNGSSPPSAPPAGEATAASSPAAAGSTSQAEGPPPWRRVPGEQPTPEEPEHSTVADSLLSEAPTAFLAGPRATPDGTADAPAAGTTATVTEQPSDTNGRAATPGVRPPARNRPPRQALLQLKRLDPWSVLKMALALAVVLFLVWMVAAGVLYGVLGGMGVWDRLNGTYADLVTGQAQDSGSLISAGRVFLLAAVVGAINSLLFAVAMTIGAFVYNVAADLVGGIEVTLSERD